MPVLRFLTSLFALVALVALVADATPALSGAGPFESTTLAGYWQELAPASLAAARSISLDRWADWGEPERLVVNIANIYAELAGDLQALNPLEAFEQMAELARAG